MKVRPDGLSEAQRRFLKTASKELEKPSTTLEDAIALRELAKDEGVRDVFDGALRSRGDRFGPDVIVRVSPFLDPATLGALRGVALVLGLADAFEAKLGAALLAFQGHGAVDAVADARPDPIEQALSKLGKTGAAQLDRTRAQLLNMQRDAAAIYDAHPEMRAKAEGLRLPTEGAVIFVPSKSWNVAQPQRTEDKKGFIDAYANEWRKGPSRTAGEPFEWDVIPAGNSALKNLSRDGSHVNVSLGGAVTHR